MKKAARWMLAALLTLPAIAAAQTTFICEGNGRALQQLRIYELNRTNREHFHQRFQDEALRIMKRHGFDVRDIWESDTGEKLQFVYVLNWPDRETMDSSWKAFLADPEWIDIKKRTAEKYGDLLREANGQPLVRLSFSPECRQR